jgi:hypothetical protein
LQSDNTAKLQEIFTGPHPAALLRLARKDTARRE